MMTERVGDPDLSARCQALSRRFLASHDISDSYKSGFADRVKRLYPSDVCEIPATVQALGLQAPWLGDAARAGRTVSADELRRHLAEAQSLLDGGSPVRAGKMLSPPLVIAASAGEREVLDDLRRLSLRMLDHERLTHEERDGFARACVSFAWPDDELRDEIFHGLGVGAPTLERLAAAPESGVAWQKLTGAFDHAERHLNEDRPGAAYYVLRYGVPLSSWVDDAGASERAMRLARRFVEHPKITPRLRERFEQHCRRSLSEGRWRSVEGGRQLLDEAGIAPDTRG